MKMLRKIVICMLILIFIIMSFNTFAAVEVTKENLKESLQKVLELSEDTDAKINEGENSFILYDDNGNLVEIKYDLSQKNPKFYNESIIRKGMSYDEYETETIEDTTILFMPYSAVANIQGVDINNAMTYILFQMFFGALESNSENEGTSYYFVNDDFEETEEYTNAKIIKKSEFGENAIEYIDDVYENEQILKDELNTFTYTTKKENIDENTRKIIAELEINIDADFSKVEEYVNELNNSDSESESDSDSDFGSDSNSDSDFSSDSGYDFNTNVNTNTNNTQNNSNNISKIPYAGLKINKIVYIVSINIIMLIAVLLFIIINDQRKK